jgi:hypothetical protein
MLAASMFILNPPALPVPNYPRMVARANLAHGVTTL